MSELFNCLSTSITLRKAIMPCFSQCDYTPRVPAPHLHQHYIVKQSCLASPKCNYAHKNFKETLCPELNGSRARPMPQPPRDRPQRVKPLPLAIPSIHYCENTGICTLPYLQTWTVFHTCHTNCHLFTEPPSDRAIQW